MKKLLLTTSLICLSTVAIAQEYDYTYAPLENSAYQTEQEAETIDPVSEQISVLQKEWAHIKYQIADKERQLEAIHALEDKAARLTATYPLRPEVKIWEGIILSTDAGIVKGISALGKVKKAKALFEESLTQDPYALDGSAYTSLGSLYYQVPGWPIAFGDKDKAETNLIKALSLNPDGIDPNYFYGDLLLKQDRLQEAKLYLQRALQAPSRPDRPLADAGRRQEIKAALAELAQKSQNKSVKDTPHYN